MSRVLLLFLTLGCVVHEVAAAPAAALGAQAPEKLSGLWRTEGYGYSYRWSVTRSRRSR